jgi:myosin heavy subunit
MKSNSAVSTVGVITFGSEAAQMFEALSARDQDRAFKLLARVVARRLGTSLHGLTVHLDEATIHAHYQLAAYNRFGDPLSKSTSPKVLSELQDLTAKVMQRFCPDIERGHRYGDRIAAGADFADTIHKSVRELHRTLPADLAEKRQSLADLADDEAKAQARVDEMQGRVDKLEGKEELTTKEVKRLETYQRRLSDRLDDLRAAQATSEAAKAEADRLADLARAEHDEMRQKVERSKIAATRITAQAEERAQQMVRGAELAATDMRDEIAQDRAQLDSDRSELHDVFMKKAEELDEREDAISEKALTLKRVTGIVRQAVDYLGEKLGLGRAEAMRDAVDQLESELNALSSSPKNRTDPFDDAGPGL